jgi:uncharacterized SAM-binding protein YcdF (DUF218 family)
MNSAPAQFGLSLPQALTVLVLPPVSLLLLGLACGVLAWHGSRRAGLGAAGAALALLLLATPAVAGMLRWSLEREVVAMLAAPSAISPAAIIVLGGDVAHARGGARVGRLTLERLQEGAALQRRTGLPLLVTAGVLSPGDPPLGRLMAASLAEDFSTLARWVEAQAADTRGNAVLSTAMLQGDGIAAAYLVSHAWHLPRAMAAFARAGLPVVPAPVLLHPPPSLAWEDWLPRPDPLAESWFALREWLGRIVYALRD